MQSLMIYSHAAHEWLAYSMHQYTCTNPEDVMYNFELQKSYLLSSIELMFEAKLVCLLCKL